jgi:HEPN domain-containing protein
MRYARDLFATLLIAAIVLAVASPSAAAPEGQLTWAVHVSLAPTWFDPAETSGIITPFLFLYALHDAMVKPIKALLNEMSVDSPKTHDPAPVFARAVRMRGIGVDVGVLDSLTVLSQELATIRGPVFYQETVLTDAQARDWVRRVERALQFGEDSLRRLRKAP